MTPRDLELLADSFAGFGLLVSCIWLLITIGLIVAIFQINGRIGRLVQIQEQTNERLERAAEIERQVFIAQLVANGPNHPAYVNYLVGQKLLTYDQADFILKQTGQKPLL